MRFKNRIQPFALVLLLIEFLDELVFGIREAAWPLIRDDIGLTFIQVGLLLCVPGFVSSFIEPAIGILGDTSKRKQLVILGSVIFFVSLMLTAVSMKYLLLLSFIVFYPASGAFVSLSQATLMDRDPDTHERNMARWTFAGSFGVVFGPVVLAAAVWVGAGWRVAFALTAILAALLSIWARKYHFKNNAAVTEHPQGILEGLRKGIVNAMIALKRRGVLRW